MYCELQEFYAAKEVAENVRLDRQREMIHQIQDNSSTMRRGAINRGGKMLLRDGSSTRLGFGQGVDNQEYDFRRDVNVLSHPRYSAAVKKLATAAAGNGIGIGASDDTRSPTSKKSGQISTAESWDSAEKYKIFRAKGV